MSIEAPDFRYDPFSQVITPFAIGYLANPKEVHTVPNSAPYEVYLNEIPRGDSPSTLLINEQGGGNFIEVSFSTIPATGQFRAVYGTDIVPPVSIVGQGTIQFNAADAGKIVECAYYGLGAIVQNQLFNKMLNGDFGVADNVQSTVVTTDTVSEETPAAGVLIDGVRLKDNDINADEITEKTLDAGVTIEGVKIENSLISRVATLTDDYSIGSIAAGATDVHDYVLPTVDSLIYNWIVSLDKLNSNPFTSLYVLFDGPTEIHFETFASRLDGALVLALTNPSGSTVRISVTNTSGSPITLINVTSHFTLK